MLARALRQIIHNDPAKKEAGAGGWKRLCLGVAGRDGWMDAGAALSHNLN